MMSARGGGRKAISAEPLIIAPDYRVALGFGLTGLGLALPPLSNPGAGVPLALIGAFLATRTQKVRFVFDDEAMEVMTVGSDGELELSGENFAVGGRNRWAYSTFTNWEFYPSKHCLLIFLRDLFDGFYSLCHSRPSTHTHPHTHIHIIPSTRRPSTPHPRLFQGDTNQP